MNTKSTKKPNRYIVLGASAGGVHALKAIISGVSPTFNEVLVIVIHRLKNVESRLDSLFQSFTSLPVCEVEDKQTIESGKIYLAPSNYHLLVEEEGLFALETSERINFSRPSIDVSFVSFAQTFGNKAEAILLTGANADGARGLKVMEDFGGFCAVQHPETAQVPVMPKAGLKEVPNAHQLNLQEIIEHINKIE